jgi:hypothetical protein
MKEYQRYQDIPTQVKDEVFSALVVSIADASTNLKDEVGVGVNNGVEMDDFTITDDKPNFARTLAPLYVARELVGDLFVIAFQPGDATGDSSDQYPEGSIVVPEELLVPGFERKGSYPRPKHQIAEVCIPLANFWTNPLAGRDKGIFYGGTGLQIVGVGSDEDGNKTAEVIVDRPSTEGLPFITLGTDSFGRRVGDPHSIRNADANHLQVAAFLAIEDPKWVDLLAAFEPINPYNPS